MICNVEKWKKKSLSATFNHHREFWRQLLELQRISALYMFWFVQKISKGLSSFKRPLEIKLPNEIFFSLWFWFRNIALHNLGNSPDCRCHGFYFRQFLITRYLLTYLLLIYENSHTTAQHFQTKVISKVF